MDILNPRCHFMKIKKDYIMQYENNIPKAIPVQDCINTPPKETASSRATLTFILGILAFTCFGILTGIPAIILGAKELKEIKNGTSSKAGETITKVGFTFGIIVTALTALILLAVFTFALIAGMVSQ